MRLKQKKYFGTGSIVISVMLFLYSTSFAFGSCSTAEIDSMRPEALFRSNGFSAQDMDCVTNQRQDADGAGARRGFFSLDFQQRITNTTFARLRDKGVCTQTTAISQERYNQYLATKRSSCSLMERAEQVRNCNQRDCIDQALSVVEQAKANALAARTVLTDTKNDLDKLRERNLAIIGRFREKISGDDTAKASTISGLLDRVKRDSATAEENTRLRNEINALNGDERILRAREQLRAAFFARQFLEGVKTETETTNRTISDLESQQSRLNQAKVALGNPPARDPPGKSAPGSGISGALDGIMKMGAIGLMGMQLANMNNANKQGAPQSGVSSTAPPTPKNLFTPTGNKTKENSVTIGKTPAPKEEKTGSPNTSGGDEYGTSGGSSIVSSQNPGFAVRESGESKKTVVSGADGLGSGSGASVSFEDKKKTAAREPAANRNDSQDPFAGGGMGGLGGPDSRLMNGSGADLPEDMAVKDLLSEMDKSLSGSLFGDSKDATPLDTNFGGSESNPEAVLAAFQDLGFGSREEASFSKELQGISLFTRVRALHVRCLKKGCVMHGLNSSI